MIDEGVNLQFNSIQFNSIHRELRRMSGGWVTTVCGRQFTSPFNRDVGYPSLDWTGEASGSSGAALPPSPLTLGCRWWAPEQTAFHDDDDDDAL